MALAMSCRPFQSVGTDVVAGLLGEVGAVVDDAGLDVPRDAVGGAVHLGRLLGAVEEGGLVDLGGRRVERVAAGELAHPRRADHGDVRRLAGGDGGRELVVGGRPRDGRDLDLDAGVGGLEVLGQLRQVVALGTHGPDGDRAGGLAAADGGPGLAGGAAVVGAATAGAHGEGRGSHARDRDGCGASHRCLAFSGVLRRLCRERGGGVGSGSGTVVSDGRSRRIRG